MKIEHAIHKVSVKRFGTVIEALEASGFGRVKTVMRDRSSKFLHPGRSIEIDTDITSILQ